jgi:hypothetical protein
VNDATGGSFTQSRRYYYKLSYTYDAIQESPLSVTSWNVKNDVDQLFNKTVTIKIKFPLTINRRITHINVYRASGPLTSFIADGFYRLLKTVPVTKAAFGSTGSSYEHTIYDSVEDTGASYEARAGVSEELDNTFVDYEMATLLNGHLFVGRCRHTELDDAKHMIFKSKPFRFDTFNWTDEYLRLPEVPTAIASYGGRLMVFSKSNTYVVNPETLVIEDALPGAGCIGSAAVCRTEFGLFFVDDENIYHTDGRQLEYVGAPIRDALESEGSSWRGATHEAFAPIVIYSSKLKQVHVIASFAASEAVSLCYHVPLKRWDVWKFDKVPNTGSPPYVPLYPNTAGAITGKNGELYWSKGDAMLEIAGHALNRKAYLWRSKKLTMDSPSQIKKFYQVYFDTKNIGGYAVSVIVSVSVDNGAYAVISNGAMVVARQGKQIQLLLTGTGAGTGEDIFRNVTVLFRRLVGMR